MKRLKFIGLAVCAVAAVMAFAGAASASAAESSVLCETNTTPCTSAVPTGTTVSASSNSAVLSTSIATVTCEESATSLKATEGTHKEGAQLGEITALSFGKCKTNTGTSCTVTTTGIPAKSALQYTTLMNGTLTVTPKTTNPGATVVCGGLINCTFTTASAALSVEGGEPLVAKANGITLNRSGGICPSTSTWTATYKATTPNSGKLWVST
jgi:hypothetical protein